MTTTTKNLKVHQRISLAILRQKSADVVKAYYIWSMVRSSGHSDVKVPLSLIRQFYKGQRLKDVLFSGDSLFFIASKKDPSIVSMRGKMTVMKQLGLTVPGRCVSLNLRAFYGPGGETLRGVRAGLYSVYLGPQRVVSRDRIEAETGVARRTQLLYEDTAGITVTQQYATDHVEVKQLPNRYYSNVVFCGKEVKGKRHGDLGVDSSPLTTDLVNVGSSNLLVVNREKFSLRSGRTFYDNGKELLRVMSVKLRRLRGQIDKGLECVEWEALNKTFFLLTGITSRGKAILTSFHLKDVEDPEKRAFLSNHETII